MPDPAITSLLSQILNPVILGSFLQGAYTTLFIYTVFLFVTGDRHKRTWTDVALFGVIVTLYISSLLYLTANWASIDQAFVKNGDSSDSIIGWLVGSGLFYSVFPETFRLLSILLADSVMIWRCSVIWHRKLIVVLPLSLMAATNFVVMVFELKALAGSPVASRLSTAAAGTTIFGLSLAVTVLSTIFIIARIVYIGTLKSVARYWNILEMVIESSALYCVSILVLLPFWVLPITNPASFALTFVQEINQGMLGIAPTLLYARVLAGGARPDSSWVPSRASRSTAIDFNSISHVHFQSNPSRTFNSSHSSHSRSQTLGKDSEVGIHSDTDYKAASFHI